MTVAVTTPAARGATLYTITMTFTIDGHTGSSNFQTVDVNDDGVVDLQVGGASLAMIQSGFGTTTFVFPGSYTGTFAFAGSTVTISISSEDHFTLEFTLAPTGRDS